MPKPIRLILADDHALLRQGTAELLRREPDLEVIGEASNGLEAVELARHLRPDLVAMDVRMPTLSGLEATRRLREVAPEVRVLVLTAYDEDQYVFSLLQAGACGYLLKSAPVSELVKAIHRVYAGETPLDPLIARKLVLRVANQAAQASPAREEAHLAEQLTARELDVLHLLTRGLSNRAMAEELSISDRTVQTHLTNIFAKLHVTSRMEAVLTAIRRGWLKLEP